MQVYVIALLISVVFAYLFRAYNKSFENLGAIGGGSKYVVVKQRKKSIGTMTFIGVLSAFPLTFVSAVREGVGTDYYTAYVYSYFYHHNYGNGYYDSEYLYNLLESSLGVVHAPSIWIFVVSSVITGGIFYYCFFRFSVNPEYSILLYFLTNLYFITLNAVRQGIAMAVLYLAIQFLKENKRIWYFALVIIATGFHQSAILFAGIYFLLKIQINVSRSIFILGGLLTGGTILARVVRIVVNMTQYGGYYGSFFDSNEFDIPNTAIQLAVFILYLFYLEKARMTEHKKEFEICFWMQMIGTFFIAEAAQIPLAKRISWYMQINQLMALPIISKVEESNAVKFFFNIIVIVLFSLSIYIGIVKNGAHAVLPYKSIFYSVIGV